MAEEREVFVSVECTAFNKWEFTRDHDDIRRVTEDTELIDECGVGRAINFDGYDAIGQRLSDLCVGEDGSFHELAGSALGTEHVDEQCGVLGSGEFVCGAVVGVPAVLLGDSIGLKHEQQEWEQQQLSENVHGATCAELNEWSDRELWS